MENETIRTGGNLLCPVPCAHTSAHADDGFCPDCGAALRRTQAPPSSPTSPGLPLRKLIPLRSFWEDRSWRTGAPLVFLLLAVLPFLWVHLVGNSSNAGHATVGFAVYFAAIWLLVIRAFVKPEKISARRLAAIVLFTPLIGLGMVLGWEGAVLGTSHSVFSYIFGVGLPEEFAKALPVFLLVFLARKLHLTPRTYLYLGAVSGLAFGAVEAVHLSTNYANGLPWDSVSTLTGYVWRLVSDPVMHACWAGISCYFIGLASTHRNKQVPLIGFGLGAAALLHGLFDFTAANWLQVAVIAFSLFVFVGYALSAERIADDYRSAADPNPIGPADTVTAWTDASDQVVTSRPGSGQSTGLICRTAIEHDRDAYGDPWSAVSSQDDVRPDHVTVELASASRSLAGARQ